MQSVIFQAVHADMQTCKSKHDSLKKNCVHTQRGINPSRQLETPSNDVEDVIWTEIWTADRSLDHKTKLNKKFYAYLSIIVARLKPDPNLSNFDKNYTVEDKCSGIMFDTKIMWWLTHEIPKH